MTTPDADLDVLTRQARAGLAAASVRDAHDVELLVDGLGDPGRARGPVLLLDSNGQPRFVCDRDCSLAYAALLALPAMLRIRRGAGHADRGEDGPPWSVSFIGRLERLADQDDAAVVCLTLAAVFVEPAAGQPGRRIPVSAYCQSEALLA